jgi:hypothetical protein
VHEDATATGLSDRLIAAYSQRYRESGRWKVAIWLGSAALFLAALVLAALGEEVAVLGLFGSGYLLCSRLVLRPEMTRAHREGVAIQEQYDVESFGLPWNQGLAGPPASPFDVEDLADRYSGDRGILSEWYVDTGSAPPSAAVLLRQFENATWGRRDHRRFAILVAATLVASIVATVVVGLLRDLTLAAYVSTLAAPALPWLLDLADLSVMHGRAAATRRELEVDLLEEWSALEVAAETAVPIEDLRENQNRIFIARRRFGRVPTLVYRVYRDRNQRAFEAASASMLEQKGWGG